MTLPAFSIPRDAFEKASEKNVDHYTDLTDEERGEEDLPARPGAEKPEPKPEQLEPEPAAKPEPEPTPAPEPKAREARASDEPSQRELMEQIASLQESIEQRLAPADEKNGKEAHDPLADLLERAAEDDNPIVRELAQQLGELRNRVKVQEDMAHEDRVEKQQKKDDADFEYVKSNYTVAGKPLTDDQVERIEDYLIEHPRIANELTIEEVARVALPEAVKVPAKSAPKPPPPKDPAVKEVAADGRIATIVDTGATGGGKPERFVPRVNETMESAVQASGRRFGWVR